MKIRITAEEFGCQHCGKQHTNYEAACDCCLDKQNAARPAYYECGICDHWHAQDFNGDCRADDARFTAEDLDNLHGLNEWDIVAIDEDGIDPDPA